jgi:hypothetical protein
MADPVRSGSLSATATPRSRPALSASRLGWSHSAPHPRQPKRIWKRLGSGKPQQSAATRRPRLAGARERRAAVDRSACSRLTSRRSPVRARHRRFSRVRLRSGTAASSRADGHLPNGAMEASWKRGGSRRSAARAPSTLVASLRVPRARSTSGGPPALTWDAGVPQDYAIRSSQTVHAVRVLRPYAGNATSVGPQGRGAVVLRRQEKPACAGLSVSSGGGIRTGDLRAMSRGT